MLSVTRSPLSSPALRTMSSASSYISTPSSPLSHSSLPHTRLPTSMSTPRELFPSSPGKHVYGSYFSVVGASAKPCRFNVPSPACRSPVPSPIPPSFSSILSNENSNNASVNQRGLGRFNMHAPSSQAMSEENTYTAKSLDVQGRQKPTFKLALPRPTLSRDDSSRISTYANAINLLGTLGTPHNLTRSDSLDSVITLKPTKGRVLTPYPQMDDSEWIEDVEQAIAMM